MSAQRMPSGGRIDRNATLDFTWNGKAMRGHRGDTLASALLANGVRVVGRSFKYHRPRGIMSAGVEESGALVTIGEGDRRDPNVKATTQELHQGLIASSQNAWPSVHCDLGAMSDLFGRFLSAGFYYKTFMGPRLLGGTALWMQFEKLIRRAAGMGAASRLPDPDCYEHCHAFCDLLVIGGGPAGLSAAATAARAGLDVLLVEQDFELGGDLLSQPPSRAHATLTALRAEADAAGVRTMTRTTAFGLYDGGVAGLLERVTDHLPRDDAAHRFTPRQRFWTARARRIIIAAGAIERPIAFGDNDRPGVMTASAARAYLHRFGIRAGARIAVATNNDSAYPTARELAAAGAEVLLLEARSADAAPPRRLVDGVDTRCGHAPLRTISSGRHGVHALEIASDNNGEWIAAGRERCDLVLVSGGWSPTIHLASHRGARPVWNAELACFLARDDDITTTAGAAAGVWRTDACIASGQAAGADAARALGQRIDAPPHPQPGGWRFPIRPLYEVRARGRKLKSLVDPQNDVTADDIRLAHREGFVSVEHLKRYTTLGMSTDGGKVGNVIGLALMADALGVDIPQVGATVFRPPYTPVALGALRGRSVGAHFRPLRRTPMHHWNLQHGAVMTMAGLWDRPWYFPRDGEDLSQAYIREATCVRECVGLCDVTSLGKIAIQGPDATAFLDRIYTNPFAKLPIGKARYGIMLRDDGIVMDDGTTWRLGENEYFMTTTTAHAAKVMAWLEELLHIRWSELKVHVTSVSEQWAGCAVAGPQSRAVLAACAQSPDAVCNDALPFMGVIETELSGGIPCRIARISFSGEMAFEVYAPSDYGVALMESLWAAARARGGCLYGLEALGALRIEKGHVTGAELDGRVSIDDAGLGKMASPNKAFVGDALRKRPELLRADRPRLVGIVPKAREQTFNAGAVLCRVGQAGLGAGWITAVTHSPALGHWIGIGFIEGGVDAWRGATVIAADPVRQADVEVEIVSPHFYDPSGERMHG